MVHRDEGVQQFSGMTIARGARGRLSKRVYGQKSQRQLLPDMQGGIHIALHMPDGVIGRLFAWNGLMCLDSLRCEARSGGVSSGPFGGLADCGELCEHLFDNLLDGPLRLADPKIDA